MGLDLTKTRVSATILVLGILYILSFGILMGMETDRHGDMATCPLTVASSLCRMNFSEHLSMWQSMFTATLDNGTLLLIVGLLVLAIALAFKSLDTYQDQKFKSYQFYSYKHQKNLVFNKFLELFSQGILNPKIYSLATL